MRFPNPRGRARHVSGPVRRRAGHYAPVGFDALEDRRLLAAGNFGLNVEISPFTSFVNILQTPGNWSSAFGPSGSRCPMRSGQ